MFSSIEANSVNCGRKLQSGSAQSSMAATPLYETPGGKFYVATPDLLSSDTDINSPDGGLCPTEENPNDRNTSNDAIVGLLHHEPTWTGLGVDRGRLPADDRSRTETAFRTHRKDGRRPNNNVPQEVKFQKSLPENCLLDSEVEMVEMQKGDAESQEDPKNDAQKFPTVHSVNVHYGMASDASNNVNPSLSSQLSAGSNESENI